MSVSIFRTRLTAETFADDAGIYRTEREGDRCACEWRSGKSPLSDGIEIIESVAYAESY